MKKRLIPFISIIMILTFSLSTAAITPRWSNARRIILSGDSSADSYSCTVTSISGTTSINATVTLYEVTSSGAEIYKDSTSGSSKNSTALGLTKSYDMSPSKCYPYLNHTYPRFQG